MGLAPIFLGPGQGHGVVSAEDEIGWPNLFSAENLELVPFLFLMFGNRERQDYMCVAPHFPRDELWVFNLGMLLRNLSQSEPLGSDERRVKGGLDSVCGVVGSFMSLPDQVNSASSFPCVLPRRPVLCVRCSQDPCACRPPRNSTHSYCWLCYVISTG